MVYGMKEAVEVSRNPIRRQCQADQPVDCSAANRTRKRSRVFSVNSHIRLNCHKSCHLLHGITKIITLLQLILFQSVFVQ